MKTKQELQQHLDWINENLKPLNEKKKALENAIKALEIPEFDFRKLMPVGSVWLGSENLKVTGKLQGCELPAFLGFHNAEKSHKEIYFAHQIVKEVDNWFKYPPRKSSQRLVTNLFYWLEKAEKSGVLQNLD